MTRIALGVEYNGGNYCGWQRQPHAPSVQEEVEKAISRVANESITVFCAGRTDTGVHATEQVIHFDTEVKRKMRGWVLGANSHLPHDITLRWAIEVDEEFHSRFSAVERSYRYVIDNNMTRPGIFSGLVTWVHEPLDENVMHAAAQALVGTHDYSSYRALGCQANTPVRTIHSLQVTREGSYIYIDVCANAFLHHMIRNIAGVLIAIGAGKQELNWCEETLNKRDRRLGGVTAKPFGLYLCSVKYPNEFKLPSSPPPISFTRSL